MDRTRGQAEAGAAAGDKAAAGIGAWVDQAQAGGPSFGGQTLGGEPLPGRLPDGYRMLRRLGAGRHGTVALCRDESSGTEVALKMLHLTVPDPTARMAAHAELLSAGAASRHACSASVEDAGFTADHHPYLAMRFCQGGTAQGRLSHSGPFPVDEVIVIGVRLALSLASAHRRGVLHLDVRPANVLFDQGGDALLAEHGVARVIQRSAPQVGAVFDPMYASREMFGWENPGPSADVYGLGATLYALLNGLPAYAEAGTTSWSALYGEVLRGELPHPGRQDLPPQLFDLIRRMMSANSDGRPPLTEVHRELRLLLPRGYAGRVPALDPEPAPEPMLPGWDPADDVTPEEQAEAERRAKELEAGASKRHRRMLLAGGVTLVLFAAGATTLVVLHQRDEKPKHTKSKTTTTLPPWLKQLPEAQAAPLRPKGLKVATSSDGVTLTWTAPENPPAGVHLAVASFQRSTQQPIRVQQQLSPDTTTFRFPDAASRQPGVCFVVASVVGGKGSNVQYAAATPVCPVAPAK